MTLNASRQPKQEHFGTSPDLKRQVSLLAGKTAKRRLNELRSTSRLPRAHHDFLSDHEKHYPDDDADFEDLHKPMRLSWDEIFVEDMLGMGGFGSVCLVTCPKLRKQREKEEREAANKRNGITTSIYADGDGNDSMNASFAMTVDDSSMGGSMMLSYASSTTATGYNQMLDPNKYYACKSLSNKTIKQANVRGFVQAAADLVQEAFLLSHINPHPNLVRLYGIPVGSIESAFDCGSDASGSDLGYFLILEALGGGILSDKIYDWRQKQANMLREQNILRKRREQHKQQLILRKQKGESLVPPSSPTLNSFLGSSDEQRKSHTGRQNSNGSKETNSTGSNGAETLNTTGNPAVYQIPRLEERLDIALQIASGMQHLHAHGIVFRDLKPHNVGLSISFAPNHNNNNNNNSTSNDSSTNGSFGTAQSPPSPPQPTQLTWRLFDFGLAREVPVSAFSSISNRTTTMGGAATVTPGGFTKTVYHSEYKTNYNNHNNFSYGYNQSVASSTTATDPSVCYGKAGSLRYMAPETMGGRWMRSSKHQNSTCFATFGSDVYAFSIVLWELVGLSTFDKKYDNNPEEFESAVCDRGHRPAMEALDKAIEMDVGSPNDSPSQQAARKARHSNIRELVYACWREDYRQRPNFDFIVANLKEMLSKANHAENENENENENEIEDDIDDNTVATDNLLNESELDFSFQQPHPPQHHHHHHHHHHHQQSYQHHNQTLNRMSNHSYQSGSGRSRRRLMRKMSARTLSSRSMLSATSMSNHSMVLEDVFEVETEHSNSAGSNKSSQHKTSSHHGNESLDSDDVDDDSDDESMANDYSIANDSLMNESVITITNRRGPSSRYMEYCAEEADTSENAEYDYKSYEKKIIDDDNEDDEDEDDDEDDSAPMEKNVTLEGVAVDDGKCEDKSRRKKKSKKKKSKKKD